MILEIEVESPYKKVIFCPALLHLQVAKTLVST